MSLYRHQEDRLPSLVVALAFSAQLLAFFLLESLWTLIGYALFHLSISATLGSISHNHHHIATFKHRLLNRCYEVILFLQTGVPPYAWTLHHNLGHHRHYLNPKLDPSAWQTRRGTMNRVKYDLYNSLMIYPEIIRIGRSSPYLLSQFYRWGAISLAVLALLVLINPLNALIIFIAPMPIMLIGLLDNTYQQHQGLDMNSDYTASRNTTNRLYNLISWNLGYHTAHHLYPGVHWSKLPQKHAEIEHLIPEELVGNSVFVSRCGKPATKVVCRTDKQQPLSWSR